jgi:hypothetical protein
MLHSVNGGVNVILAAMEKIWLDEQHAMQRLSIAQVLIVAQTRESQRNPTNEAVALGSCGPLPGETHMVDPMTRLAVKQCRQRVLVADSCSK